MDCRGCHDRVRRWLRAALTLACLGTLLVLLYTRLHSTWYSERLDTKRASYRQPSTGQPPTIGGTSAQVGRRTKVLILTIGRSGSSFVGEMFQQHPHVAYMFEPLRLYQQMSKLPSMRRFLNDLFECRLLAALNTTDTASLALGSRRLAAVFEHRSYDTRIQSLPLSASLSDVQRVCASHRYVVIKVIRVTPPRLQMLRELASDDDVLVVHLVRDPRAVVSSKAKVQQLESHDVSTHFLLTANESLVEMARVYCERVLLTLAETRGWRGAVARRYRLVRYEDVATRPLEALKAMYRHVGLSSHARVFDWLANATTAHAQTWWRHQAFTTSRNSSQAAHTWRTHMPFELVDVVQRLPACRQLMAKLGYRQAATENILHNTSVSLVSEWTSWPPSLTSFTTRLSASSQTGPVDRHHWHPSQHVCQPRLRMD